MENKNKFNKVLSLDKSMEISSMKDEWYNKVMMSTDFSQAAKGTGQDVCKCFFNSLWGTISHILQTNEMLIEEEKTMMIKHADLIEEHKLLEIKYESVLEQCKSLGIEIQEAGDDKTEEGS